MPYYLVLERLKDGNIHMCFFSRSGYRPFINPPPVPRKSTFRYNSMFNFIPVCFFVNFRVRVSYRVRVRVRDR